MTIAKDELPGRGVIGPYRLLGKLGRGGMAEVYLAEHRHLAQVRALKLLLPELGPEPALVGRLLTEARATARLRHPGIVEVFDCDTLPQGGAFIAMEYLRGEPVNQWLSRAGHLADYPRLASALVGIVAGALGYAHEQGVLHRDIKPENLFLIPDAHGGRRFSVKVVDFGVAKLLREEPLTKTRDGAVIGTPVYMSPEQCRSGALLDRRTDIYGLGCVFFELLSGRPPFIAADGWDMMRAHMTQAPPTIRELAPQVPEALELLLGRMLAKPPNHRPQDMHEVIDALAAFVGVGPEGFAALLEAPAHAPVGTDTSAGQSTEPGLVARPGGRGGPVQLGSPPILLAPPSSPANRIGLREGRSDTQKVQRLGPLSKPLVLGLVVAGVVAAGLLVFGAVHLTRRQSAASAPPSAPPAQTTPTSAEASRANPAVPPPVTPAGAPAQTTAVPARAALDATPVPASALAPDPRQGRDARSSDDDKAVRRPPRRPAEPRPARRSGNVYQPVGD